MRFLQRAAVAFTRVLPRFKGSGRLAALVMERAGYMSGPVELPVYGAKVSLRPDEFIERWLIFAPQLYDYREIQFLERWLRPGDVFLDIGAHIGVYSLAASRMVGVSGVVIAIEPDPMTFERLSETVGRNQLGNVRLVNAGVSDRRERLRLGMNVFGNRGGSSFIYHPDFPGVEVECVPLAALLASLGIERVRGAKLDIEGFEHRVLSALFADTTSELWPELLILEYAAEHIARTGDVVTLVLAHGYRERLRAGQNRIFART